MKVAVLFALSASLSMATAVFVGQKVIDNGFKRIDKDNNGVVTVKELYNFGRRQLQKQCFFMESSLEDRFRQIDTSGDGLLSFQEFFVASRVADATGNTEAIGYFQRADKDDNRLLSFKEWRASVWDARLLCYMLRHLTDPTKKAEHECLDEYTEADESRGLTIVEFEGCLEEIGADGPHSARRRCANIRAQPPPPVIQPIVYCPQAVPYVYYK